MNNGYSVTIGLDCLAFAAAPANTFALVKTHRVSPPKSKPVVVIALMHRPDTQEHYWAAVGTNGKNVESHTLERPHGKRLANRLGELSEEDFVAMGIRAMRLGVVK